jgi:TIR domain
LLDVAEAEVDVTGDWSRDLERSSGPHYVPGIEARYYVPFTGDRELFGAQPSTFTAAPPQGILNSAELEFVYRRPGTNVAETKAHFDHDLAEVKRWLQWANADVAQFNRGLPRAIQGTVTARLQRLQETEAGTEGLGIAIRRKATVGVSTVLAPKAAPEERYDVALSFAGENRAYVEQVAELLRVRGIRVFYDDFEKVSLWGKNLVDHLAQVYQHRSRFVVMFISAHYVAKAWPKHERQHAQARAILAKEEYILPTRFDDTEVPGLTNTVGYIDLKTTSPAQLADLISAKLA